MPAPTLPPPPQQSTSYSLASSFFTNAKAFSRNPVSLIGSTVNVIGDIANQMDASQAKYTGVTVSTTAFAVTAATVAAVSAGVGAARSSTSTSTSSAFHENVAVCMKYKQKASQTTEERRAALSLMKEQVKFNNFSRGIDRANSVPLVSTVCVYVCIYVCV